MSNARKQSAPVVLVVLDGWGWREETYGNAIAMANTPTWDRLVARAPRTLLDASGLAVGLPEGQMGNSEVGHLNLGAGRVVPQDLVRINQTIARDQFIALPAFAAVCAAVVRADSTLHLAGLLGWGGVHARASSASRRTSSAVSFVGGRSATSPPSTRVLPAGAAMVSNTAWTKFSR